MKNRYTNEYCINLLRRLVSSPFLACRVTNGKAKPGTMHTVDFDYVLSKLYVRESHHWKLGRKVHVLSRRSEHFYEINEAGDCVNVGRALKALYNRGYLVDMVGNVHIPHSVESQIK